MILVSGSASLSSNDLVLAATRVPLHASGIFFYGTDDAYYPLGDGFVCVGGQVGRLSSAPTGPFGFPELPLDLNEMPTHVPPIQAGESRSFQYWFRDIPAGMAGFNYSNAAEVTFVL